MKNNFIEADMQSVKEAGFLLFLLKPQVQSLKLWERLIDGNVWHWNLDQQSGFSISESTGI